MNIDNREERMKDVSEVEKILRAMNKRKESLELRKKLLEKEIYDASKEPEKLKSSLHVKANPVLTAQSVQGYVLCDHSVDQINENEKTFSASCEDAIHSFKMSVKINQDKEITSVDLNFPETSAILEVKDLLATILEERCPHLLLLTIQQFVHLYCFRVKVIQKLTSSKAFQVYHPQFDKHKGLRPTCLIIARSSEVQQSTIEIQWTFRWNNAFNSLVHHFIIPKQTDLGPGIQRQLDLLRDHTFLDQNQHWLMKWWVQFRNQISSL